MCTSFLLVSARNDKKGEKTEQGRRNTGCSPYYQNSKFINSLSSIIMLPFSRSLFRKAGHEFFFNSLQTSDLQKPMSLYFDYNATTPLEPSVLKSINNALEDAWGNPSSKSS